MRDTEGNGTPTTPTGVMSGTETGMPGGRGAPIESATTLLPATPTTLPQVTTLRATTAHPPQTQEEGLTTRIPPEGGGEGAEEEIGDTPRLHLVGTAVAVEGEEVEEVSRHYALCFGIVLRN